MFLSCSTIVTIRVMSVGKTAMVGKVLVFLSAVVAVVLAFQACSS